MKISLEWLADFTDLTEKDPQEIARRLTASVGEIDKTEVQGELLQNCCVGKILTLEKHPNADRLSVCTVQTNDKVKHVVCGGSNLRVGMFVAFAHVGARVRWHGTEMVTLEPAKIRGVQSEGMICAAEELDLASRFPQKSEKEIIDLPATDGDVGKGLREFLGLTDVIFHIDNHAITQRADLFSHIGVARELVALGLATWKKKAKAKPFAFTKNSVPFAFINDIKDLVPRYCACVIEIDTTGETPAWMKRRLEATGWRSVSLPVDITNYVAMEVGMPLHAFDAGDLRGDVHIRLSKKGESIVTLDEVKRDLPDGAIVLSDTEGIFDLLGVMGGLRSSTKATTKKIYLHAAAVDPASIRRTVIATGHRTDAATVYEKGVPRIVVEQGFLRAVELFLSLVPGARITSEMETWGENGSPRAFDLPLSRVTRTLGMHMPPEKAVTILQNLGCTAKVSKGKDPLLTITTPLWRLGDLKGEHDLVEEIARIAGYDSVEPVLPSASISPPPRDPRMNKIRDTLCELGYFEILPLSLVGPSLLKRAGLDPTEAFELTNPIGEETSLLHTSMLPSLLDHAQKNLALTDGSLRAFHWGQVFGKKIEEHAELAMLFSQQRPSSDLKNDPFLLIKRDVQDLLSRLGYDASVAASVEISPSAHPGRSGDIHIAAHHIGIVAAVHPNVTEAFEVPAAAFAVLHLTELLDLRPRSQVPRSIPLFPAVAYDDTIDVTSDVSAGDMLRKARGAHELLETVEVVDIYRGPKHAKDACNLTLRFTYRSPERTLTEEEVRKAHTEVLRTVTTKK